MKVLKFGGSSLADANRFIHVATLIEEAGTGTRTSTVLSAPKGVTNTLEQLVDDIRSGLDVDPLVDSLHQRLSGLVDDIAKSMPDWSPVSVREQLDVKLNELQRLVDGCRLIHHVPAHLHAKIRCMGEYISVVLMQSILQSRGMGN